MVRICEASSSEYFTPWGVPGNQRRTGVTDLNPVGNMDGELRLRDFYRYETGWQAAYRPKDPKVAEKLAWLQEEGVKNWRYVGYAQWNGEYPREGYFDALMEMDKPEPRLISKLVNTDCCAYTGANVYFAGVYEPKLRTMNTSTEDEILMGTGAFLKLTDPVMLATGKGLQRGDILLFRTDHGHTCVVTEGDQPLPLAPFKTVYCVSVNMRSGPSTDFDIIDVLPGNEIVWFVSWSGNWAQVKHYEDYGYISGKYLAPLPKGKAVGNTWLRKSAGTSGEQIIVIPLGAEPYLTGAVTRVGLTKWYECIYAGERGWASGKYIKE